MKLITDQETLAPYIPNMIVNVGGDRSFRQNRGSPASRRGLGYSDFHLALRDECISQLLPLLPGVSQWLNSDRADYFGGTLFPTLEIVEAIGSVNSPRWDKWLELRPQVVDIEASLAEEWFSPELMSALRAENLRSDLTQLRKVVVAQIKAQVVSYLRSGSYNSRRLADIVNFIRQSENDFKEWHQSETSNLFAPPVFRNEKKSSGYFF